MPDLHLTLITGRSLGQGKGISRGKFHSQYTQATGAIELNASDMARAGFSDGDRIRLTTAHGSTEAICRCSDLPEGLAFMAFGTVCNRLVGGETHASGMPDSKLLRIEVASAGD